MFKYYIHVVYFLSKYILDSRNDERFSKIFKVLKDKCEFSNIKEVNSKSLNEFLSWYGIFEDIKCGAKNGDVAIKISTSGDQRKSQRC